MSSREIAELTQKRHDNVMTVIKDLKEKNILLTSNLGEYKDSTGRTLPCFYSDKRDSLIIVARLSPEFTAAVIDRWQELESQQMPKIPQTYAAALLEAGRLALELESQTKRIEKLVHSGNSYTTSQIAKETGFKSAYELNQLLANQGLIYKQRGVWLLIAKYSSKGYQEIKQTELENGKIIYNATWTDSGREFLLNFVERI